LPAIARLQAAFEHKSSEFNAIVKIGRTHLQDATPVTLGQEFSGYAAQAKNGLRRIHETLPDLFALAQGGTAVGTGVNTAKGFRCRLCRKDCAANWTAFGDRSK
jgi:fumarate hydratase class II